LYLPVFAILHDELELAKSLYSSGELEEAGVHLDKARKLRSKISRQQRQIREFSLDEWGSQLNLTDSPLIEYLPIVQSCNQLWNDISEWLRTVIGQLDHEELLQSPLGLNLLLDEKLPPVWDFNHDIVVLWGVNIELLVAPLLDRGQAQIILILDGDTEGRAPVSNPVPEATVLCVKEGESLTDDQTAALKKIEPPLIHGISFGVDEQPIEVLKNLARQAQKDHVLGASARRWPTIFTEQLIENLPLLIGKESVSNISSAFFGKDILIVSPGPSLRDSLPNLKRFRENFVIISLVRSLKILFDNDIVPDFAIMIDAQNHYDIGGLNLIPDHSMLNEVSLIVSEYTHGSTFEAQFNNIYLIPTAPLIGGPISSAIHGDSPPILNGSGVATFAIAMAAELGARSITIIGQDLSLAHGSYADDEQAIAKHDDVGYLTCTGINGEKLPTKADYLLFISELQALAEVHGGNVAMFNSTSFGAYLEGWQHNALDMNHPIVSSNQRESLAKKGFSREVIHEPVGKVVDEVSVKQALKEEIYQLKVVQHLTSKILQELDNLLASESDDISILAELEQQLLTYMTTNGALIAYYSTHAKLATEASLQSVEKLTDNFMVSSDYYGFIAASANRLIKRLSEVRLES
jgi:hypothetical protein